MRESDTRQWTVGETVRLHDDDRLMTVVRCHANGEVSVAWFDQRKMRLVRVRAEQIEPVVSEVAPPGVRRNK